MDFAFATFAHVLSRRIGTALLAAALAAIPGLAAAVMPVPPLTSPVIDTTGTLAPADIARLEAQALALQRRNGAQLQVLMLPGTALEPIDDYAQRVFDTWKLGRQDLDNGVLIVVARDDRGVRIHTGSGLESVVDDATAARLIREYMVPKFRRGDYAGGLDDATLVLSSLLSGGALPPAQASNTNHDPLTRAIAGLVLGLLVAVFARVVAGYFEFPRIVRVPLVMALAVVPTLVLAGGVWFTVAAALVALLLALIELPDPVLAAGRRGRPMWDPEALTRDPNSPEAVVFRPRSRRRGGWLDDATSVFGDHDDHDDGSFWDAFRGSSDRGRSSGGSSSGGSAGGGWSGGGGGSRGGGASGRW